MILLKDSRHGQPLVLICALMCDDELYESQYKNFSREFRVMIFRSEDEESPSAAAAELVKKLAALGIRSFILGGLSLGGYICQELIHCYPQAVSALILMDTRSIGDREEEKNARLQMINRIQQGHFEKVVQEFLTRILSAESRENVALFARILKMMRRLGPGVFTKQLQLLLNRRDTSNALGSYSGPVLCLCGAVDTLTPPEQMRKMAELFPRASFRVIPGNCGHLSTIESPDLVNAKLAEFLS
jgi:pimeloyl-ACP methyl ester carboxylesterase